MSANKAHSLKIRQCGGGFYRAAVRGFPVERRDNGDTLVFIREDFEAVAHRETLRNLDANWDGQDLIRRRAAREGRLEADEVTGELTMHPSTTKRSCGPIAMLKKRETSPEPSFGSEARPVVIERLDVAGDEAVDNLNQEWRGDWPARPIMGPIAHFNRFIPIGRAKHIRNRKGVTGLAQSRLITGKVVSTTGRLRREGLQLTPAGYP